MPAKFNCKICKKPFVSFDLDRTRAVAETGQALKDHVTKDHKQVWDTSVREGLELTMMASALSAYNTFIEIDPTDDVADRELEELTSRFMGLCGFDREGEGEETESPNAPTATTVT